jgi:hypothetical protein
MRTTPIMMLISMLVPAAAHADPIFIGDGRTHNVDSSASAYVLQNGILNILPGSSALSVSANGSPSDGSTASVSMTGGQVSAGIEINQGSLDVSGGQAQGYNNSLYGGDAITVVWGTANISGGTFTGGNTTDPSGQAGSAVVGSAGTADGIPFVSTLKISGGTFSGGTGAGGYYGGSTGYSLLSIGNTTVTGGHFQSPIAINTTLGGYTVFLGSHLMFRDQTLSGVLLNGDPINVRIFPDSASAVVNAAGTEVDFGSPGSRPTSPGPVTPVPEASSGLIFGMAVVAFGLAWRQRAC